MKIAEHAIGLKEKLGPKKLKQKGTNLNGPINMNMFVILSSGVCIMKSFEGDYECKRFGLVMGGPHTAYSIYLWIHILTFGHTVVLQGNFTLLSLLSQKG